MNKEDILKQNQKTINKEYDFFLDQKNNSHFNISFYHFMFLNNDIILFYIFSTRNLLYNNNSSTQFSFIIFSSLLLLSTFI